MISAIVLAAGQSTRMGMQKMFLPWGETTVIGKVISTVLKGGVSDIHVVTGGTHAELMELLHGYQVHLVFNMDYANGEMLTSIQVGIGDVNKTTEAIMVVLGDQPQIEARVVNEICERYLATQHPIIVPSYKMHRGHPWLLGKSYWDEILALRPPLTLHNFLINHNGDIDYVNVDRVSVIQDLDTQQDYSQSKP